MSFFLHGAYHGEVGFADFCTILACGRYWKSMPLNVLPLISWLSGQHFRLREKIFFSALKSCVLNDLKWCNMRWEWKKDEKKFEKSLQVQKKSLPLQSRYETRAPHWGGRVELTGSGKAVRKGSSTGKVHWKDWRKYKEASTKTQRTRALISFRN